MKELLDFSIHAVNIIPTILMVFVTIYWLVVMLGVLDISSIDFDLDLDIDAEVNVETEVDLGSSIGWFNQILIFFGLGQIPLMVFLSFLALPLWFISIVSNDFISNTSFVVSLLLLIPNFIVSLFIAKFLTMPFIRFFNKVEENHEDVNVVGKVCLVLLETDHDSIGQAEIRENGSSLRINIRSNKGIIIKKGDSALVIDYSENKNIFIVEPYTH